MGRGHVVAQGYLPQKPPKENSRWIGVPEIAEKWYPETVGRPGGKGEPPLDQKTGAGADDKAQEKVPE